MDLLTIQEAATMMRVSSLTIRRHISHGTLAAVRFGRRVRVPREALARLVKPVEPKATKARSLKGKRFSLSDPLWNIVGIAQASGPTDVSENKDKYLAEAYSAEHE
jgi:excisionase family DNA binding protein